VTTFAVKEQAMANTSKTPEQKVAAKAKRAINAAQDALKDVSNGCYESYAEDVMALKAATDRIYKVRDEAWRNSFDALVTEIDAAISAVFQAKAEAYDLGAHERSVRRQDKIRALDAEIREAGRNTAWMKG
jgi:hypothetical protein